MKAYLSILKAQILSLWQFRVATILGVFTQVFWGILLIMILRAFYSQAGKSQPISISQTVTFIWIGQALLQLLPWNVDPEIEQQIRFGNIVYELILPIDLYWLWFFKSLAKRIVPTILKSFILFLISGLFFNLSAPVSSVALSLFLISFLLAILLSCSISTMITIFFFWTISGRGLQIILPPLVLFFSGTAIPLMLFPKWMQSFLNIQPLRGLIDIPCRLYLGFIDISESIYFLGFQFLWSLIFIFLGKILINKALKRVVIQGG